MLAKVCCQAPKREHRCPPSLPRNVRNHRSAEEEAPPCEQSQRERGARNAIIGFLFTARALGAAPTRLIPLENAFREK